MDDEAPPLPPRHYSWSDIEDNDEEIWQSDDDLDDPINSISIMEHQKIYSNVSTGTLIKVGSNVSTDTLIKVGSNVSTGTLIKVGSNVSTDTLIKVGSNVSTGKVDSNVSTGTLITAKFRFVDSRPTIPVSLVSNRFIM